MNPVKTGLIEILLVATFYLCYAVRGKVIEWDLQAIKPTEGSSIRDSSSGS